jgi:uncharacterized membrane protein
MTLRPDVLVMLLALGVVSFACRVGGFWIMRFVTITPRLEAALKATPIAVMVGIIMPSITKGNPVEIAALAITAIAMRLTGNDLIAMLAGIAVVAGGRALQLAS